MRYGTEVIVTVSKYGMPTKVEYIGAGSERVALPIPIKSAVLHHQAGKRPEVVLTFVGTLQTETEEEVPEQ